MPNLYAVTGRAAEFAVDGDCRKNYRECRRRNVYMRIDGDEPVESFFFDDSDYSLICRADLLESESINVAAYLCRLYREKGDRFVNDLRGTFAVILYDHKERALKAWTDHFGAERLVYREFDQSVAVSTNIQLMLSTQGQRPAISLAAI